MFVKTPTQNQTTIRTARERQRRWKHTYDKLLKMKKSIDDRESSPGARVYSLRMYDIVLGNERPTQSAKQSVSFYSFISVTFQIKIHVQSVELKMDIN